MLIIHIHNDGTGDITTGNYEYSVYINRTPIAHGRVVSIHAPAQGATYKIQIIVTSIEFTFSPRTYPEGFKSICNCQGALQKRI